jgi:hypothetical protein
MTAEEDLNFIIDTLKENKEYKDFYAIEMWNQGKVEALGWESSSYVDGMVLSSLEPIQMLQIKKLEYSKDRLLPKLKALKIKVSIKSSGFVIFNHECKIIPQQTKLRLMLRYTALILKQYNPMLFSITLKSDKYTRVDLSYNLGYITKSWNTIKKEFDFIDYKDLPDEKKYKEQIKEKIFVLRRK